MNPRELLVARVRRVRRRALLQGAARSLLAGLAGAGVGPLASALVLPWARLQGVIWASLALSAMAGLALARWEWTRAAARLSRAQAADLLASLDPALRNRISTGADLAAWGEDGAEERGASVELAAAQIGLAAASAETLDPRQTLPAARMAPALAAACAVGLLLVGWIRWDPGRSVESWRAFAAPRPVAALTVGNLRLVYDPPAYTGLPRSTLEGVSGAVEALRGTRVTLEGQLSTPVQGGLWEGPDGQTAAVETQGREFRVSWVLDRAGSYELSFERGGRRVPSDFQAQTLALRPDERPKVELRVPAGDVETPSDREVEVEFEATDDFRVDRAELVLQGETEARVPVRLTPGAAVRGSIRFLALAYPKVGAGGHLRVEAWDSDNVSGPKAGVSRSVYVSFLDRKRVMDDIQALQERLFEALLAHLADHLEARNPTAAELESLRGRASDLLKLFDALTARVGQVAQPDSPGAAALVKVQSALRAALEPFLAGGSARGEVVAELERDILFLDRLMKNLQMEETLSMGDELSALQRSLFDDLQAGRAPKDLLERVSRIEKLLQKMAERLSKGSGEMPDAFMNADAARDMPSSELQEQLQKLRKALREGKTEEARKLAEKVLETLSRWLRSLQDAAERASGADANPALKDMARLEAEVQGLLGDQERILQETRSLGDESSRRAADALRREMNAALARLEQRLNAVADLARRTEALTRKGSFHGRPPPQREPPPSAPGEPQAGGARPSALDLFDAGGRVSAALSEVRQALRSDLGRAKSGVEAVRDAFGGLARTVERSLEKGDPGNEQARRNEVAAGRELDALVEELEGLDQRRLKALTPKESQSVKNLSKEENRIGERTRALAEKLAELSRRTPFIAPSLPGQARSAQGRMGRAGEKLGQGDPFGAIPPEGEALEGLSEIARALGEARRKALPGGKGPGGFTMMRVPGGGGDGREGGREVDRSRVEIPREAEARELKAFREEVMRAMRRGGYPRDYEEEVERYYERLIR